MFAITRLCSAALIVAGLATTAHAETEAYKLDESHTAITFKVDHLGYSMVYGFFRKFDAEIDYDPEAPEDSSIVFSIDAASVDTLWEGRDKHVRNRDFLHVKKNPEIVFKSTKIEMTGSKTAKLTGDLTIIGETREETFDIEMRKSAPSPLPILEGRVVTGFHVRGTIDRTDYGMKYAVGAIGSEIDIEMSIEIYPEKK